MCVLLDCLSEYLLSRHLNLLLLIAIFAQPDTVVQAVAEDAVCNTENLASDRVVKKMTVVTPPRNLVEAYLAAIAKTYNVMYNCESIRANSALAP